MPDKLGRFTGKEQVFMERMGATGDAAYAAEKAGYAFPSVAGPQLMQRPAVAEGVRSIALKGLGRLVPKALKHFEAVLDSPTASNRDKTDVGKAIMGPILAERDVAEALEPHEMTAEQLQRRIEHLRHEAAERSKPIVDIEPNSCVFD